MHRKPIFDAVRTILDRSLRQSEVQTLDKAINQALSERPSNTANKTISAKGIALIKRFEGCARKRPDGLIEAYPDPGSRDGKPWTIGWGSTGSDVGPETVWTQAQCDARFKRKLVRYVDEVAAAIGDTQTSQAQFDAMVSFHYNTGAIHRATLTKLHRNGDFRGVEREFRRWVYNDGKVLKGLKKRREAEAYLYASLAPNEQ